MTTESLSVTIEGELLTVEIGTVAAPAGGGGGGTWGGITGTLSTQTDLQSALDLKAPLASPTLTGTPAAPTAAGGTSTTQIATTAFTTGEITTHAGATDPHGDRAFATSAVSAHSALTTGAHGISAAGAALIDDADAAAQRTTLGLGTAATQASSAFEASGAVSTHNAVATAHGISAFGATLVDDADASAARTTLGLGTAATSATSAFEAAGGIATHAALTTVHGISAFGATLVDDADASAARTTLGLAIGTNVQAYDADLTTWAGITPGTGVATALGTNVGSAGAVVTNGGALGTPSSATLTNATGLPPAGITQSGAASNQVLTWNGSAWAPATPSASPGGSDTQSQYNNAGSFAGLPLWRVDANTLWQYNGTTAQTFLLSGTRTDASNYEALSLAYVNSAFEIAPVVAGTGVRRPLRLGRRNDSTYGYIELSSAGYGVTIKAFYGNASAANVTFNEATGFSGTAVAANYNTTIGKNGIFFGARDGNITIVQPEKIGYDDAASSITFTAAHAYSAASTNLVGGSLYFVGGKGATASAGLATGGSIYLDGGQGYGTGAHGNVYVGNTRGKLQLKAYAVASLGAATPAGMRAFANDANATTFHSVVAGGGANFVPVFSDGTDWRIG